MAKRRVACLGDPLVNGAGQSRGSIITSGQEGWTNKFLVNDEEVAVEGATSKYASNPIRTMTPTVSKSFANGKKIIVEGDGHDAGGDATVAPTDRGVYVE